VIGSFVTAIKGIFTRKATIGDSLRRLMLLARHQTAKAFWLIAGGRWVEVERLAAPLGYAAQFKGN